MKRRIVLLDTHAIIHRAYHALPDFKAKDGTPTGALFGLSSMLASIIRELKPDYIFACYDLPGKTFRHEAFEAYKGTRKKGDDELISQLISSQEIISCLNIPIYAVPGYEADDIIGTIAKKFANKDNYDIIIASGDMDTLQLVEDKHVRVFTLKKGLSDTVLYDEDGVVKKYGFSPEFIPDYKGLRGDPSDNIPGVPGVGEKTATILIQKFKTIENLYKVLKKKPEEVKAAGITDRILKILLENEENAIFSKMLGSIRTDAEVKVEIPDKTWVETFDREKADKCFKKFEFKTMLARFDNVTGESKPKGSEDFKKLAGPRISPQAGPDASNFSKSSTPKNKEKLGVSAISQISENIDPTDLEEAKIMLWLLNSEKTNPSLEDILEETGADSFIEAKKILEENLKQHKKLVWLFENVEKKLISIVSKMSERGIMMDESYLKNLSKNIHRELVSLEKEIKELSGEDFNLNSPKQLSHILFEVLLLPTKGLKKRKDGMYSTDVETLNKFKDAHPIVNKMLEYRELEKLRSTYIDAWPNMLDKDGVLHPQFMLTGTVTGRVSSHNPNVQNIPIRGERGKEIRRAFVARPGFSLVAFDYSQIELRAVAMLSQDPYLIEVFRTGSDIHSEVASRVYNVPPEEVTKDMRRHAKVINFGVLYGMGSTALAKEMGISRTEAKNFIDTYFSRFPKVAQYIEKVLNHARKTGYTETLFGRRRQIPGIKSNIPYLRAMAERMAGNAPIQGTATADIIRLAIVNIEKALEKLKLESKVFPLLQIHDELVFEIEDNILKEATEHIKSVMEEPLPKEFTLDMETVPILVETSSGKNWGDMV